MSFSHITLNIYQKTISTMTVVMMTTSAMGLMEIRICSSSRIILCQLSLGKHQLVFNYIRFFTLQLEEDEDEDIFNTTG